MLLRASVVVLTALLAQSASATWCRAGTYRQGSGTNYRCITCPAGQYTPDWTTNTYCQQCPAGKTNNPSHTGCDTCPAGQTSVQGGTCQNCPAGKESNPTRTQCVPCPGGKFSTGGTQCQACPDGQVPAPGAASCQTCPAGQGPNGGKTQCSPCTGETFSTGGTNCMSCPAGTDANPTHTGCDKCPIGYYNGNPGGQCKKCSPGSFNNVVGATKCCNCCAGFYANGSGNTSCTQCPGDKPYSNVGVSGPGECKTTKGPRPYPTTSCDMISDNVCPNPTGTGPVGTVVPLKRQVQCPNGFTSCPRLSGVAGLDCVDTENDPESCGGCVGLEGTSSGTDCTAIKGTSATRCVKGSCVIDTCRKGWVKSLDGSSCTPASEMDTQDTDAKKMKRSSAKRSIRHTMF